MLFVNNNLLLNGILHRFHTNDNQNIFERHLGVVCRQQQLDGVAGVWKTCLHRFELPLNMSSLCGLGPVDFLSRLECQSFTDSHLFIGTILSVENMNIYHPPSLQPVYQFIVSVCFQELFTQIILLVYPVCIPQCYIHLWWHFSIAYSRHVTVSSSRRQLYDKVFSRHKS